jgi:hypothetical protein
MSCLMISELPLSEQIALELLWSDKLLDKARAVLTTLYAPAEPAGFHPLGQPHPAGASISLPSVDVPSIVRNFGC